ncbi:MAG TPA: phage tail protein [Kofleriaceae bacterium]|nr:phage tail protein [Kofleriaceae bacterium]
MANPGTRNDPLPVFCFKVKLMGGGEAFFKSVSGLKYETEVVPVREGGANDTTFQLPGATKWANLVLKQGFTSSSILLDWREKWIAGQFSRQSGTITQLDTALNAKASWDFKNGWPCKWEISEFDASKSELAIETLELAIEGLKFTKLG